MTDPLPRHAHALLMRLASAFPVLALTGPRQSGKTTLARMAFPAKPYLSLEDIDTRERALADPRQLFANLPQGAILDEVQRAPELLSYLQGVVDTRGRMGDFIITGSQQFGLRDRISQSLAGRAGSLQLLPLSLAEIGAASSDASSMEQTVWQGGYPALFDARRTAAALPSQWFSAYIASYIERDVRQVLEVTNLSLFQRFVLMCASRTGSLLNLAALAADCGISQPTARSWLSVLEASYVVRLLQPFHQNLGKRLVKTPKLYFLDTGLLCHLLRIDSPQTLATHAMRGAIFECWVVSETLKYRFNRGLDADLYFWRDNHGTEIDLVFEHAGLLHAVEIKSGATFASDWTHAAARWRTYAGASAAPATVVYGGHDSYVVGDVQVMSWRDFA
ncbi:ATP-binding protein [Pseudorhodoferax sp. Leaf267]|uniref:ATP-binding protein n=1 Tax=Pseudorhodoferax sp. Leaf267 TaxID=1736316 RepID=UPI0006FA68B0|nr:ATP-binding protein [Pseudorhodoferax sp. Leaf267]KQP21494.1 AAA family ATPase [Pseudorhodoferax sp. Leaf267]